jgi:hypothetical protein
MILSLERAQILLHLEAGPVQYTHEAQFLCSKQIDILYLLSFKTGGLRADNPHGLSPPRFRANAPKKSCEPDDNRDLVENRKPRETNSLSHYTGHRKVQSCFVQSPRNQHFQRTAGMCSLASVRSSARPLLGKTRSPYSQQESIPWN